MGGCASKPKDLDTEKKAPAPLEAPEPPSKTADAPAEPPAATTPESTDAKTEPTATTTAAESTPATTDKAAEAKTEAQEKKDGNKTKEEKPLVDASKPAPDAPKIEEVTTAEAKPAAAVIELPPEDKVVAVEEVKKVPQNDAKVEVAEITTAPKV